MEKKKIGNKPYLYPYPVVMVGTLMDGKPNFMTIAFCGIVNMNPGMLAIGASRHRYTNRGIFEHRTFSVNLPSREQAAKTDFVGIYSGKNVDKSALFDIFYGQLQNAPMIRECPLNMECKVLEVLDLGGNDLIIIGEIVETYTEDKYLTSGYPDIEKMQPFVLSMFQNLYFTIGPVLGKAWDIGKSCDPRPED